ncbi:unnamed protein product, partial [Chrysoparadoxa australica]
MATMSEASFTTTDEMMADAMTKEPGRRMRKQSRYMPLLDPILARNALMASAIASDDESLGPSDGECSTNTYVSEEGWVAAPQPLQTKEMHTSEEEFFSGKTDIQAIGSEHDEESGLSSPVYFANAKQRETHPGPGKLARKVHGA